MISIPAFGPAVTALGPNFNQSTRGLKDEPGFRFGHGNDSLLEEDRGDAGSEDGNALLAKIRLAYTLGGLAEERRKLKEAKRKHREALRKADLSWVGCYDPSSEEYYYYNIQGSLGAGYPIYVSRQDLDAFLEEVEDVDQGSGGAEKEG